MSIAVAGLTAMTLQDILAGGTTALAGVALVVSATVGCALGSAVTKRFGSDVDPIAAAAVQLLLGAVPLAILAFLSEPFTSVVLEPRFLALVIVLGIGGTAVTFTLWISVLKDCPLKTANAQLPRAASRSRSQCRRSGRERHPACDGRDGPDDNRDRACRRERMNGFGMKAFVAR